MTARRLELNWSNKDQRLLSHGADTYEWVDPSDWRVSEVRLLEPMSDYGEDPEQNLAIHGDALHALTALTNIPELREHYLGKVQLCYIDPPFNTGQTFAHYDDAVEHSVWLTMLRDRLIQIHKLLSDTGSVWVHLDDAEAHRARCVLDEVFGAENFVATVIWQKVYSPRMDAKQFSFSHDYIHVYSKRPAWRPNAFAVEPNLNQFPFTDSDGRRYRSDPLRKWGTNSRREDRPNLWYPITAPSGAVVWPIKPDGSEGNWRWQRETYEARASEVDWLDKGHGLQPYLRQYADTSTTRPPETFWSHLEAGHNHEAAEELKRLLGAKFSTPKPERLLERVLAIGSRPGDIVLDCFAGSATTAGVAHKMGRRWVTVELLDNTLNTFVLPRLEKVVEGKDLGGISSREVEEFVGDLPEGLDPEDVRRGAELLLPLFQHGTFADLPRVPRAERGTDFDTLIGILRQHPDYLERLLTQMAAQMRRAGRVQRQTEALWAGGGGFRLVRVAPSMFEADEDGDLALAEWAVGGELARAVCAQMRYRYEPEGPFAGVKGRSRLAVLDGMLTEGVAQLLVSKLDDNQTLLVVAQAVEPGVEDVLRSLRSGSKVRKMPRDLARAGILPSHLVTLGQPQDGEQS